MVVIMIKITDIFLLNVLNDLFNDDRSDFSEQEINEVMELYLYKDSLFSDNLSEIKYFKKVKKITFKDLFINRDLLINICQLDSLEELNFYNCNVSCLELLNRTNIIKLVIDNCIVDDLYAVNNLKQLNELYLDNLEMIDLKKMSIIRNIKVLSFVNTNLINEEYFIYMNSIERLAICGSQVKDISNLLYFDNLKILVIDEDQAKLNKEYVMELRDKHVKVVDYSNRDVVMYYE